MLGAALLILAVIAVVALVAGVVWPRGFDGVAATMARALCFGLYIGVLLLSMVAGPARRHTPRG